MALRKEEGCKIFSETRQGKNEPADVSVRASIWNYKTSHGSHLFSTKSDAESGRGVCNLLFGIKPGKSQESPWISKNDGIDGTGISLFLHPVYFIQFSMTQMKERG